MFILIFVLILSVTIIIHELGHLVASKYIGFEVDSFIIGQGKELFKLKFKETNYIINTIPLGGRCITGVGLVEDFKMNKKNMIIMFTSGIFFNIIFGIIFLIISQIFDVKVFEQLSLVNLVVGIYSLIPFRKNNDAKISMAVLKSTSNEDLIKNIG